MAEEIKDDRPPYDATIEDPALYALALEHIKKHRGCVQMNAVCHLGMQESMDQVELQQALELVSGVSAHTNALLENVSKEYILVKKINLGDHAKFIKIGTIVGTFIIGGIGALITSLF